MARGHTLDRAGPIARIITGSHEGADRLAARYAREHHIPFTVVNLAWKRHGKRAPMERDKRLIAAIDRLIAFHDGRSEGTAYAIHVAHRVGRVVEVVEFAGRGAADRADDADG